MPCEFCPAVAGTYCGVCGVTTVPPRFRTKAQPFTGTFRLGSEYGAAYRGVIYPLPFRTEYKARQWLDLSAKEGRASIPPAVLVRLGIEGADDD